MKTCFNLNIEITGDNENKDLQKIAKSEVSGLPNLTDERYIAFTQYLSEDKFKLELINRQNEFNREKGKEEINSIFDESGKLLINKNIIYGALNRRYKLDNFNVDLTRTQRHNEELQGFINSTDKRTALQYTGYKIRQRLYDNYIKYKNQQNVPTIVEILTLVKKDLELEFNKDVVPTIFNHIKENYSDEYNKIFTDINKLDRQIEDIDKQLNDATLFPMSAEERSQKMAEKSTLIASKRAQFSTIISKYGSNKHKNWNALILAIRGDFNGWLKQTINTTEMFAYANIFKDDIVNTDFSSVNVDEDSVVNESEDESIDESTKRWSENIGEKKSFYDHVDSDIVLYLSLLPNLKSPVEGLDVKTDDNLSYNTDNGLGVSIPVDYRFIIAQVMASGPFNNIDGFMTKIRNLSLTNDKLYSLAKLYIDMKKDDKFAHRIFNIFNNPVISKSQFHIGNEDGLTISNRNTSPQYVMLSDMLREVKDTIFFEDLDKRVNLITTVISNISEKNRKIGKDGKPIIISGIDKIREEKLDIRLANIIYEIFPSISPQTVLNYINFSSNPFTAIQTLSSIVNNIMGEDVAKKYINAYNALKNQREIDYQNYLINRRKYLKSLEFDFAVKAAERVSRYVNKNEIDDSIFYTPIISLRDKLLPYHTPTIELNSRNVEGNLTSDVIDHNHIINIMERIAFGNEESSNKGLEELRDFISRGEQYKYSTIFFGIKDNKGKVIVPGIFTRNDDGTITINKNAKQFLKVTLFNGVDNQGSENSVMYDEMSQLDYMITQIIATNSKVRDDVNKEIADFGYYFLRTPADKPKNFTVTAPKISSKFLLLEEGQIADPEDHINHNHTIYRGFIQNVLGELNLFINQLNNIFERKVVNGKDVWILTNNTNNLFENFHYKNGNFLTEDGKYLSGNVFNIFKLFKIGNIDYGKVIIDALSLYRGSNNSLLKKSGNSVVLNLNHPCIAVRDGVIELNLNNDILRVIENQVAYWMTDYYYSHISNIYDKNSSAFKENNISKENFVDYVFNSVLMNYVYDDIYDGSIKFYKNMRTAFKRGAAIQAAGKAYDGINADSPINIIRQNNNEIAKFGDKIITDKSGFTAITIKNRKSKDSNAKAINEMLYRKFIEKDGLNEKEARRKADAITAKYGYSETTEAKSITADDAQSYITLDEFVRRRYKDGTLGDYLPLLQQLYDPNIKKEDLALNDKDNTRIQVQKNVYFDIQYDERTGIYYPRFIKNAEFVLIPKLIEGTPLMDLYNAMVENNIDQVNTAETDKAAQRHIIDFWNNPESINDNSIKETYFYSNLYKQQEVKQHMIDAENKFGIQIARKINDGFHHADEKVQEASRTFMKMYCANIKESFTRLMDSMDYGVDENGRIYDKNTGSSEILNLEGFYEKFRNEAYRLGVDKNFLEYLTLDNLGNPLMPNWMNNVSSKLESIAQAVFNKAIIRQTFPGFHAAQVSNTGQGRKLNYFPAQYKHFDGTIINEDEYNKLSNEDKTDYVLERPRVVEVMIPRNSKLIPKGYDISKLEKEGLDLHIGYRIPTEGKQSVAIMKVVEFLDDVQGSTIVVPDSWVAQTGSDFDIDTIYDMSYHMRYDFNTDTLKKIEYDTDMTEKGIQKRYIRYVNRRLKEKIRKNEVTDEFIQNKCDEVYKKLVKNGIFKVDSKVFKGFKKAEAHLTVKLPETIQDKVYNIVIGKDVVLNKSKNIIQILTDYINNHPDAPVNVKTLLELETSFVDLYQTTIKNAKATIRQSQSQVIEEIFADAYTEQFNDIVETAKESKLLTYEEFKELPLEEQNTKEARDNKILDSFIIIMQADSSLDENLTGSHFVDLTADNEKVTKLRLHSQSLDGDISENTESLYNPFTNLSYHNQAMSGLRLKAVSVNTDTAISVHSMLQTQVNEKGAITIIYNSKTNKYDFNTIKNNFEYVNTKGKTVYHNRIGNSKTGRNIVNEIITSYASQTTSHILDAIKEGNIFNENLYTFNVFKHIVSLGTDYYTALLFLQQPGITRIVNEQNAIDSIYVANQGDGIYNVIKTIAKDLGIEVINKKTKKSEPINEFTPIGDVIDLLDQDNKLKNALKEIIDGYSSIRESLNNIDNVFNQELMENRFKLGSDYSKMSEGGKYYAAAFDLYNIFLFNNLNKFTRNLTSLNLKFRADKSGIGQTVYETKKFVNEIIDANKSVFGINKDGDEIFLDKAPASSSYISLTDIENNKLISEETIKFFQDRFPLGRIPILWAVYPLNDAKTDILPEHSLYPYLAAFLKYGAINSLQISEKLFPLEGEDYQGMLDVAQKRFNVKFNQKQITEYKKYFVNTIYHSSKYLMSPVILNEKGQFMFDEDTINELTSENINYEKYEISRVYGYNNVDINSVKIENITEPTAEEIKQFNKLSPVQKVSFIKHYFKNSKDNIFRHIKTQDVDYWTYKNKGYEVPNISINSQINDPNYLIDLFNAAAFNSNPLIKLTAFDLIKYSYIVQGGMYGKNTLSKVISNDAIKSNLTQKGLGLLDAFQNIFRSYSNNTDLARKSFIHQFVKSHSGFVKTITVKRNSPFRTLLINSSQQEVPELLAIPNNEENVEFIGNIMNEDDYNETGYTRIIYKNDIKKGNKYQDRVILYKYIKGENYFYLYPLNLLEANEVNDISINSKNNLWKPEDYYETIIEGAEERHPTFQTESKGINYHAIRVLNDAGWRKFIRDVEKFKTQNNKVASSTLIEENYISDMAENASRSSDKTDAKNFITQSLKVIKNPSSPNFVFIENYTLNKIISDNSPLIQTITDENGKEYIIEIRKYNITGNLKNALQDRTNEKYFKKLNSDGQYIYYHTTTVYPSIYRVTDVTNRSISEETNIEQQNDAQTNESEFIEDDVFFSSVDAIDATDMNVTNSSVVNNNPNSSSFTPIDQLTKEIFIDIQKSEHIVKSEYGDNFIKSLDLDKRFDIQSPIDIIRYRDNILKYAAEYYKSKSRYIINELENFTFSDGTVLNANSPEFLDKIKDNITDLLKFINLINYSNYFGYYAESIFSLPLEGIDEETSRYLTDIKAAINTVRNNINLNNYRKIVLDDYLASNFSTNPLIRDNPISEVINSKGITNPRLQYGDIDFITMNIAAISELPHKTVQLVVKWANRILTSAKQIEAPKAVQEFIKEMDTIMNTKSGTLNYDNIIKNLQLVQEYLPEFVEKKRELDAKVADAELTYGRNSIQHIRARHERNEFRAKNIHQYIVKSYYDELNKIESDILNESPNIYAQYMQLVGELYDTDASDVLISDEELERRADINAKIRMLKNIYNDDLTLKSEKQRKDIDNLNKYIEARKAINDKYFDKTEIEGFNEKLKTALDTIKRLDEEMKDSPLIDKLKNDEYKEAYNWIKANTYPRMNPELSKVFTAVFDALKDPSQVENNNKKIKLIMDKAGAYDVYGNPDPSKLNEEDIAKIKELSAYKDYANDDSKSGGAKLIKEIPKNDDVYTEEFYSLFGKRINDPNKDAIIEEINSILRKGLTENGEIRSSKLWENTTQKERIRLGELYSILRGLNKINKNNISKEDKDKIDFKTNTEAFNREVEFFKTLDTKEQSIWRKIFVQHYITKKGVEKIATENGRVVPNNFIYGYITPTSDDFIDKKKTEAKRVIREYTEWIPIDAYYIAAENARQNGTYDKWYNDNHVYNPFTGRMEPIKCWTKFNIKEGVDFNINTDALGINIDKSKLTNTYDYILTGANQEKYVKAEYINNKYDESSDYNYNLEGNYTTDNFLTEKEIAVRNLFKKILDTAIESDDYSSQLKKGFMPRQAKIKKDKRYYGKQLVGMMGIEIGRSHNLKYEEKVDYIYGVEHPLPLSFMETLRTKGTEQIPPKPVKTILLQGEEYEKKLQEWYKEVDRIKKQNIKLEEEIADKDWYHVMQNFIYAAVDYNARKRISNMIYLLQEELLREDNTYVLNTYDGNLRKDNTRSTEGENIIYKTKSSKRTAEVVDVWAHRTLYGQYKKNTKYAYIANQLQNITSSKYMITNLLGGISNVLTGMVNISGEFLARDYFSPDDFRKGQGRFYSNVFAFLRDAYKPTSENYNVAITKLFQVVNFDDITERKFNEKPAEFVTKFRDALYGFQTGGEFMMQNSVLFAVLNSHRIYRDTTGKVRIGSLQDYTWDIEYRAMLEILKDNPELTNTYRDFINSIRNDLNELKKYDTYQKDFNAEFLRNYGTKELKKQFIAARKEIAANAKKEFIKNPKVEESFVHKDGIIQLNPEYGITEEDLGGLIDKIRKINDKIHGVYDRIGAAKLETEWYGGLLMQYHKHIYPGIMKRWRTKGYYNETRGTIELGSYISLYHLLSAEFNKLKQERKRRKESNNAMTALESIQAIIKTTIDTILNFNINYNIMPSWEKRNIRRAMGDLLGIFSAIALAIAIHALTDDDEIDNSRFANSMLYLADRWASESAMYLPNGMISEFKTLWSSPIASLNAPNDLMKAIRITSQWLVDPNFEITYKTGLYAGKNKLGVLVRRNIPILRVYDRIENINKNNQYYRINDNALNYVPVKAIGDAIGE